MSHGICTQGSPQSKRSCISGDKRNSASIHLSFLYTSVANLVVSAIFTLFHLNSEIGRCQVRPQNCLNVVGFSDLSSFGFGPFLKNPNGHNALHLCNCQQQAVLAEGGRNTQQADWQARHAARATFQLRELQLLSCDVRIQPTPSATTALCCIAALRYLLAPLPLYCLFL